MINELLQSLFLAEGRLNRQRYIIFGIIVSVASTILNAIVGAILGEESSIGGIISLVISIAFSVPSVFFAIRRFHDLNEPGTKCWFLLIPFYNIYLIFLLLFKKGTEGPNTYGADRLQEAK